MKKLLVCALAALMVCSITACGGGKTADTGNVGGLSEEELAKMEEEAREEAEKEYEEELAKQEEEARKEMEESLKQEEENKKESAEQTQPEVDPEAVLTEALPTILPIPEGEYEYGYQWSDRLNRVDYYTIHYNTTVNYEVFIDYMLAMVEDGFEDPGKGEWSEEDGETFYLSRREGKVNGVRMNWKPTGNGDEGILTFEIYVNPYVD